MSYRLLAALLLSLAGVLSDQLPSQAAGATPRVATWQRGWPMFGHDPARTNHSPVVGPLQPRLLFTHPHVYGPPLIGSDGSLYVWSPKGLLALDATGRKRWLFPSSEGDAGGPPALSPTKHVLMTGYPAHIRGSSPTYSTIFSLGPHGHLRWKIAAEAFAKGAAPLVTEQGSLYTPFVGPGAGRLDIVSPDGMVQHLANDVTVYSVAQAADSTVYAFLKDHGLAALGPNGQILWEHSVGLSDLPNLPLTVGSDRIYVACSDGVEAFNTSGQLVWHVSLDGRALALAQDVDGSLLVADAHTLNRLTADGQRVWSTPIGTSTYALPPALLMDADGTSYVAAEDGNLRIITREGKPAARLVIGPTAKLSQIGVAMGPDGRLAVVGTDERLRVYAP